MTPASPILPPAGVVPVAPEMGSAVDHGAELKRGMFFNTIALLASNFRGVFTFLIARLLGAAVRQLHRGGGRYVLYTMCIGVGQGIAMIVERV